MRGVVEGDWGKESKSGTKVSKSRRPSSQLNITYSTLEAENKDERGGTAHGVSLKGYSVPTIKQKRRYEDQTKNCLAYLRWCSVSTFTLSLSLSALSFLNPTASYHSLSVTLHLICNFEAVGSACFAPPCVVTTKTNYFYRVTVTPQGELDPFFRESHPLLHLSHRSFQYRYKSSKGVNKGNYFIAQVIAQSFLL